MCGGADEASQQLGVSLAEPRGVPEEPWQFTDPTPNNPIIAPTTEAVARAGGKYLTSCTLVYVHELALPSNTFAPMHHQSLDGWTSRPGPLP
jgi:hypothetical protein